MGSKYLDNFKSVIDRFKKYVDRDIDYLKNNGLPEGNGGSLYSSLSEKHRVLGIGEIILNKNYIKAKESFFIAAKYQQHILELINNNDNRISNCWASMNYYKSLYLALLSESTELTSSLALLFGNRPDSEKDDYVQNSIIGYVLKCLILKDTQTIEGYLNKLCLLESKKNSKYDSGIITAVKGLANNNETEFKKGLELIASGHSTKKELKNTPDELICIEGLGIMKLAMLRGISFDKSLSSNILPAEVIETHSDFTHEYINFIS